MSSAFRETSRFGVEILRHAVEAPMRQIAENAGYSGSVVLSAVRARYDAVGFDAERGRYVGMIASGILDPTRVTCSALDHAASVAGLVLTSEVLVTELPPPHTTTGEVNMAESE